MGFLISTCLPCWQGHSSRSQAERAVSERKRKRNLYMAWVSLGQICGAVSQPLLCAFRASIRRVCTAKIEKLADLTKNIAICSTE